MDISWHKDFAQSWLDRGAQDRQPHAVLLAGPPGVGKRAAATWIAARRLGLMPATELPQYPAEKPAHPDLHWIAPPEDKAAIGIDQIRGLVAEFSLTSYEGGGKVVVIEPANLMTTNAANSLLKTLEEPPGDALLVLVADRTGRLPATIFSRCQRIEFLPPAESEALAWLDRLHPGAAWAEALILAGNAPLAALAAVEQLDTHASMGRDFAAVAIGGASAIEVAARWSRLDTGFVLDWLARQVQQLIMTRAGGSRRVFGQGIDDSVLGRMDTRNLFCYLDIINRLRGQPGGSFNVQLTLEGLLLDLAENLKNCRQSRPDDGMQHMLLER
jgi:DNA polymerase-3 subunit delta'